MEMPEGWKIKKRIADQMPSREDVLKTAEERVLKEATKFDNIKRISMEMLSLMKEMAEALEYISEESNDPRATDAAHEVLNKFKEWK